MESREDKIAVVAKWLQLVDNGDIPKLLKGVDELYHDDFVAYFASSRIDGIEAMRDYARNGQSVYAEPIHEVAEYIVEGDKVVARIEWTATHVGELMGIKPTGKKVSAPMTSIYQVVDGKIKTVWVYYDSFNSILNQLKE